MKIDIRLLIAALLLGITFGVVKSVYTSRIIHTYHAYNYNGDLEVIHATSCQAIGVTLQFTLTDGTTLWLIDVSEVREVK